MAGTTGGFSQRENSQNTRVGRHRGASGHDVLHGPGRCWVISSCACGSLCCAWRLLCQSCADTRKSDKATTHTQTHSRCCCAHCAYYAIMLGNSIGHVFPILCSYAPRPVPGTSLFLAVSTKPSPWPRSFIPHWPGGPQHWPGSSLRANGQGVGVGRLFPPVRLATGVWK